MYNPDFTINLDGDNTLIEFNLNGGTRGIQGEKGNTGNDGFSPLVDVSKEGKVATITITDVNGTHIVQISDGIGDMEKSVYDTDDDGKVDSAEDSDTVNGHTVEKDVPSDAVFTDTTYTAGTGISIENDTIINTKTKTSDLTNDSGFITKEVDNLTNYTPTNDLPSVALSGDYDDLLNKPDLSQYATTTQLGNETTARENADIGLQGQIDAITSSSDVRDIVGTYQDLQNYDTSSLGNDDIIKVLQDSTHNDAMTYYRWVITGGVGAWSYIGQEGPYYTKSETETLLQAKQNTIDSSHKLSADLVDDTSSTNKFVSSSDITNWNSKQNALTFDTTPTSDSTNPVTSGGIYTYVNTIVGDIATALNTINGENI